MQLDIDALSKNKASWVVVTRRATPDETSICSDIVTLLSTHAYPLLQRIDSLESGFDAFLATPQVVMSDLMRLETKIAFLTALGRKQQAAEEVRRALDGRGADDEDPFAESVREMARSLGL